MFRCWGRIEWDGRWFERGHSIPLWFFAVAALLAALFHGRFIAYAFSVLVRFAVSLGLKWLSFLARWRRSQERGGSGGMTSSLPQVSISWLGVFFGGSFIARMASELHKVVGTGDGKEEKKKQEVIIQRIRLKSLGLSMPPSPSRSSFKFDEKRKQDRALVGLCLYHLEVSGVVRDDEDERLFQFGIASVDVALLTMPRVMAFLRSIGSRLWGSEPRVRTLQKRTKKATPDAIELIPSYLPRIVVRGVDLKLLSKSSVARRRVSFLTGRSFRNGTSTTVLTAFLETMAFSLTTDTQQRADDSNEDLSTAIREPMISIRADIDSVGVDVYKQEWSSKRRNVSSLVYLPYSRVDAVAVASSLGAINRGAPKVSIWANVNEGCPIKTDSDDLESDVVLDGTNGRDRSDANGRKVRLNLDTLKLSLLAMEMKGLVPAMLSVKALSQSLLRRRATNASTAVPNNSPRRELRPSMAAVEGASIKLGVSLTVKDTLHDHEIRCKEEVASEHSKVVAFPDEVSWEKHYPNDYEGIVSPYYYTIVGGSVVSARLVHIRPSGTEQLRRSMSSFGDDEDTFDPRTGIRTVTKKRFTAIELAVRAQGTYVCLEKQRRRGRRRRRLMQPSGYGVNIVSLDDASVRIVQSITTTVRTETRVDDDEDDDDDYDEDYDDDEFDATREEEYSGVVVSLQKEVEGRIQMELVGTTLSLGCNPEVMTFLGRLLYIASKSRSSLSGRKTTSRKKKSKKNVLEDVAVALQSIDITYEDLDPFHKYEASGHSLSLRMKPPSVSPSSMEVRQGAGVASFQIDSARVAMTFLPHLSLKARNEDDEEEKERAKRRRVMIGATANDIGGRILVPPSLPPPVEKGSEGENGLPGGGQEASMIRTSFLDLVITERVGRISDDKPLEVSFGEPTVIVNSPETEVELCEQAVPVNLGAYKTDQDAPYAIVRTMNIKATGKKADVSWSPVFHWFMMSGIKRTQDLAKHCQRIVKLANSTGSLSSSGPKPRSVVNVVIDSTNAKVAVRALLGSETIMDVETKELIVESKLEPSGAWTKPSVRLKVGPTRLRLDECMCDVATFSSIEMRIEVRLALDEEVEEYWKKAQDHELRAVNPRHSHLSNELVTDNRGRPLKEIVNLRLGKEMSVQFPPDLQFGKVINDLVATPRLLFEGLAMGGVLKPKKGPGKFQLMTIKASIPFASFSMLEYAAELEPRHPDRELLCRMKVDIIEVGLQVERNTPPQIIQDTLDDLDEDESCVHTYGPVIQGGIMNVTIGDLIAVIHPVTLVTPSVVVRGLEVSGLFLLAGLRPDTDGLAGGRSVQFPLACHHCYFVDAISRGSASELTPVLCGCSFEVPLKSTGVPPKVFINLHVDCREVEASYGILMMAAIPRVLEIVQRLTPPPPPLPSGTLPAPPLAWWDNLLYWIHGNVGFLFKSLHVRWLLDTEKLWERSIIFKSNDCFMQSRKGDFRLSASNMILTLPGMSYHLIDHEGSKTYLPEAATVPLDRHPLMLIPHLEANFEYEWILSRTNEVCACDHHSPYMAATKRQCREEAALSGSAYHDHFLKFRTNAIKVKGSATLEKSADFVNWMALRIDVLPWVTHQNPDVILPLQALKGKENPDAPEPLPTIESLTVAVSAQNLYVLSWFYESGKPASVSDDLSEAASDGVCLIVPRVRAKVDLLGEKAVDIDGPIQATLLDKMSRFQQPTEDVVLVVDAELERFDRMSGSSPKELKGQRSIETSIDAHEQLTCEKNDHIHTFFANLQQWSRTVTEYDYLMVIEHVDIFTKALQAIVLTPAHPGKELEGKAEPAVEEEMKRRDMTFGASTRDANETWTVLVSEMKLLWTLHIRDCVMSIVSDLLYTIDCMRARASAIYTTLVQEEKDEPEGRNENATVRKTTGESSLREGGNRVEEINEPSSPWDDLDALPASSISNESYQLEEMGAATAAEFNSSLSYLLDGDRGEHQAYATNEAGDLIGTAEAVDSQGDAFAAREERASRPRGEAVSALFGPDDSETVPSLDIHLSNLQIQLHSESTGGSVVLAMRGAYVEGRHFVRLFVAEHLDPLIENISPTDFLRKSEYQAILDCMEVYSISTDPSAGLQWLETVATAPKELRPGLERDERSLSWLFHQGGPPKARRGMPQFIFPRELHHHQAKDFRVPGCLQKIMTRSTFQTRSVVYRPPAHLSEEQLRQHIREGQIRPLWDVGTSKANGALPQELDYTDLFLDELSFHLDADQFNTTLDLFRNVFLAPKKRSRERQMVEEVEKKKEEPPPPRQLPRLMSESVIAPAEHVQDLVEDWNGRAQRDKGRKMRDALRSAAQALTATLDDRHRTKGLLVVRRVEYTLGTARWHIQSEDFADDVEINFTEFHGQHDFSEDGAVDSHLGLGDIRVVNLTPGPDSKAFYDSSAVLDTAVGAERSPCQRCGRAFERAANHATACVFHSGTFRRYANGLGRWSCCRASSEDSTGCVSRPHSGSERAIDLRLEALPQTVQGITMYKHVEVNFFPNLQHTLVVQVTNGLAGLFNAYFLPEEEDDESIHTDGGSLSEGGRDGVRKNSSFGYDPKERGGKDKPTKLKHTNSAPESPKAKQLRDSQHKTRKEEVFFVQYWRVGHMKVVLSFAGFPLVPDTFNLGIAVPEYSKVYKVGGGAYLGRKYVSFLIQEVIKSAASSGFIKVRDLLLGNKADPTALGADPLLVFDGGGHHSPVRATSPRRSGRSEREPDSDHVFVQPSKERIEEARATFFLGSLERKSKQAKEKRQQARNQSGQKGS